MTITCLRAFLRNWKYGQNFCWKAFNWCYFVRSRGTLKELDHDADAPEDDTVVIIDFPEFKGWKGLYSEIELVPGCGFEVGQHFITHR